MEFFYDLKDITLLMEYTIIVPLFGEAYAAPNKGKTILC